MQQTSKAILLLLATNLPDWIGAVPSLNMSVSASRRLGGLIGLREIDRG
jgi:hypothetical protein